VGTTPTLNGFFASMDRTFGYARQKSDAERAGWWDRDLTKWPYDELKGFGVKDW